MTPEQTDLDGLFKMLADNNETITARLNSNVNIMEAIRRHLINEKPNQRKQNERP